jgi:hypothetical protein
MFDVIIKNMNFVMKIWILMNLKWTSYYKKKCHINEWFAMQVQHFEATTDAQS